MVGRGEVGGSRGRRRSGIGGAIGWKINEPSWRLVGLQGRHSGLNGWWLPTWLLVFVGGWLLRCAFREIGMEPCGYGIGCGYQPFDRHLRL